MRDFAAGSICRVSDNNKIKACSALRTTSKYSARPTVKEALCLAAAVIWPAVFCSAPAAAQAKDANPFTCGELRRDIEQKAGSENARQLNFEFFEAAKKGCGTIASALLAQGASLEARDRFANTPLIHAAANGHVDLVDFLLDQGALVNAQNLSGSTALLRAVIANERKTAKRLLERGAAVFAINRSGITPLAAASYNGNRRMVQMLLDAGAEADKPDGTGKPPVIYAAAKGYSKIVALFLEAGVPADIRDGNDLTPLMWAAGHPNDVPDTEALETIKVLLDGQADIDLKDNRGRTALMISAARGHAKVVAALIEAGADRSATDNDGKTAADLTPADKPDIRALLETG